MTLLTKLWRTPSCVQRSHSCERDMLNRFLSDAPKTVKHPARSVVASNIEACYILFFICCDE
jgi:hypothetical protein